ncbi:MAG TPA: LptA/OstA family protein [Methylocystis sp.]|nr:LptA/OstA family protein [Methylocystis sp.]
MTRASEPKAQRGAASFAALALILALGGAAQAKSGAGVLPGASASDPLSIDSDKVDYFDREQKAVYSGSVIVVNGPSTLKASRMTIFLDNKPKGGEGRSSEKVKHIDAEGPITLVSKDQTATGDAGKYDRAEQKVYLIGNVTLTQGETVTKGDRLVYDISTGQAGLQAASAGRSQGRVHSLITPKNQ